MSHLDSLDLEAVDSLVLSPRQKTALRQELKVRRLGLAPWSDLSPWQRLSRTEQERARWTKSTQEGASRSEQNAA